MTFAAFITLIIKVRSEEGRLKRLGISTRKYDNIQIFMDIYSKYIRLRPKIKLRNMWVFKFLLTPKFLLTQYFIIWSSFSTVSITLKYGT